MRGAITIVIWLWTGTALIPEKPSKDVGRGLTLPIYVSGPQAVGWWAMFITMIGDLTAFASLVFGYFFYWTIHEDFPPRQFGGHPVMGPGSFWPLVSVGLGVLAWVAVLFSRYWNRSHQGVLFYVATVVAVGLAVASAVALFLGPYLNRMDPTQHAYTAIVCALVLWTVVHLLVGTVMLVYCAARRIAGRMDAVHDADLANVTLCWHFLAPGSSLRRGWSLGCFLG